MLRGRTFGVLAASLWVLGVGVGEAQQIAGKMPMATLREIPPAFGTDTRTVTVYSALSFVPITAGVSYATSPSFGRYSGVDQGVNYYTTLDLPAGAVIDYIGLNSTSDTNAILGVGLWRRDRNGFKELLTGFSAPAHGWDTDLSGPLGILIDTHLNREYILDVEQASSPEFQFWAWVEVHWHRSVSGAPASATFNDVPTNNPYFQFVEALYASGITAGCGNGNFCPNNPVTRGQMATFLAKALGLHWPN